MVDTTVKQAFERAEHALSGALDEVMAKCAGSFMEREATALRLANEMVRAWIENELRRMSSRYVEEVLVDGDQYRRHSSGVRRYHSLCGALEVRRDVYRRVGVHNGPTVVPLELEAGIMANATPALAASVLQGFSMMPLRHYEDEMKAAHRVVPSRSSLERIGKKIGTHVRDQLPIIEPIVRAHERVPREAHSISVGLDRTTIPMAEPTDDDPPAPTKRHVRRRPAPVVVAYRMAYVATLALNDRRGESITSIRIASTANEGPRGLLERLEAELRHVLKQRPKLPVVIIQDGAPELWNLVDQWLDDLGISPALRLIDRYHLNERLAATCDALEDTPEAARQLNEHWQQYLDRSDGAMQRICSKVDRWIFGAGDDEMPWAEVSPRVAGGRASIASGHLGYFRNCTGKTRYATARRRGFPIGSGVTEGACKSVVATRFKRSGQRWFESGASPCLHLRALYLNKRLLPIVEHLVEERQEALQYD